MNPVIFDRVWCEAQVAKHGVEAISLFNGAVYKMCVKHSVIEEEEDD